MGKKYIDGRGWKYQVMEGFGAPPPYKARYQKPGSASWRQTEEAAQSDLDQMAVRKGWELADSEGGEKPWEE